MSKGSNKDDRPDDPAVVRHRPALPDGVPKYVTPSGMRDLRAELAAAEPGDRRDELDRRIAGAVLARPPGDRDEIRSGARVTLRREDGEVRRVQIVGVDEANPATGLVAFVAPLARALLGRRAGGAEELEVMAIDYDDF